MTVTAVRKDTDTLTMTITSEFEAAPERIWQLWADPRQLERWWGPPMFPATFPSYDMTAGGRVEYHMTGPEGEQPRGYWVFVEVDPPRSLVLEDGFLNDDGTENNDLPVGVLRMRIEEIEAGRSRMTIDNEFPSAEAMELVLGMGMEEGMTMALAQIDDILAEDALTDAR